MNRYELNHERYIVRFTGLVGEFPKIVGRVMGGTGYFHYQLARRPYDEQAVGPFHDIDECFEAADAELKRRDRIATQEMHANVDSAVR
jgi:hypothetical protein